MKQIYIRDPMGKPIKATLLRRVKIRDGFENLGVVVGPSGLFFVTELRTGAGIGYSHFSAKEAIEAAKEKINKNTVDSFLRGIESVVTKFGELPKAEGK